MGSKRLELRNHFCPITTKLCAPAETLHKSFTDDPVYLSGIRSTGPVASAESHGESACNVSDENIRSANSKKRATRVLWNSRYHPVTKASRMLVLCPLQNLDTLGSKLYLTRSKLAQRMTTLRRTSASRQGGVKNPVLGRTVLVATMHCHPPKG